MAIKTNRKEYLAKYEERRTLNNQKRNANYAEDFETSFILKEEVEKLDKEYFDKLPKVNVSFSIGTRSYYREVVKIGKTYFDKGEAMTGGCGYYGVTEIDEITDEMRHEMMSDSYYY